MHFGRVSSSAAAFTQLNSQEGTITRQKRGNEISTWMEESFPILCRAHAQGKIPKDPLSRRRNTDWKLTCSRTTPNFTELGLETL
ncbi:hypothetical protein RP20_CCG011943 [Aedes albopictus]|nr:hypothetical protein RP20_CCG011943 [Aedes albopictus]